MQQSTKNIALSWFFLLLLISLGINIEAHAIDYGKHKQDCCDHQDQSTHDEDCAVCIFIQAPTFEPTASVLIPAATFQIIHTEYKNYAFSFSEQNLFSFYLRAPPTA